MEELGPWRTEGGHNNIALMPVLPVGCWRRWVGIFRVCFIEALIGIALCSRRVRENVRTG